jgi:ABC-type transport system substrate-binding protein
MTRNKRGLALVAATSALVISLTACGGGGDSGGADDGQPQTGGTLKVVGAGDVDHLDTASAYTTVADSLARAWARRLFSFRASNNQAEASRVVPDVAAEMPTAQNGGISEDGLTYTIKLRSGVQWNTQPVREVVAEDFVRGIKRLCNPNPNGTSGGIGHYRNIIEGYADYCDGYAEVADDDAQAMADYQNNNDVSGLEAVDDKTLRIKLTQPTVDLPSRFSMGFTAPAPREYDAYVPDSEEFRQNTISNGPYQITKYTAQREIVLGRNPAWKAESDPLRKAYVDGIQVVQGQASPDAAQQQIEAGTADLLWDHAPPSATISTMRAEGDDRLGVYPGANTNPFLKFNHQSPNNNRAMDNLKIRQAISFAINKDALAKIYGGRSINRPLSTVLPPGSTGFQRSDIYPTPNFQGDVNRCRTLLAQGLQEIGVSQLQPLIYVYRNSSNHPKVTQSVADNLKQCGIPTKLQSTTPDDFYGKFLSATGPSREGLWDIAAPGWVADWPGENAAAFIPPLFDGRECGEGSTNYGCYNSEATNNLIDQALRAKTKGEAARLWAQADQQIMRDAAFVPFMVQDTPLTRSERVHNALFLATAQLYDYTNIWLSQ